VVERRTRGREVSGSTFTHCAVEYGLRQAAYAHLPQSPSSILRGFQPYVSVHPYPFP